MYRQSKPDLVYDELKCRILSGALMPRERLVTSRLAREFAVSEIPVREAINRLEAEALITVVPNSGAFVSDMSSSLMQELFAVRSRLEGLAGFSACPHLTEAHFGQLEELLASMQRAYQAGDKLEASRFNRESHSLIYRASPFTYLQKMISDLMQRTERARALFALVPGYYDRQSDDHRQMIQLLRQRDAAGVEALISRHLLYSATQLDALVSRGGGLIMSGFSREERR